MSRLSTITTFSRTTRFLMIFLTSGCLLGRRWSIFKLRFTFGIILSFFVDKPSSCFMTTRCESMWVSQIRHHCNMVLMCSSFCFSCFPPLYKSPKLLFPLWWHISRACVSHNLELGRELLFFEGSARTLSFHPIAWLNLPRWPESACLCLREPCPIQSLGGRDWTPDLPCECWNDWLWVETGWVQSPRYLYPTMYHLLLILVATISCTALGRTPHSPRSKSSYMKSYCTRTRLLVVRILWYYGAVVVLLLPMWTLHFVWPKYWLIASRWSGQPW